MKRFLLPTLLVFGQWLHAAVVTTFDEATLPAAIQLDVPNSSLGNVVFDAVNDELDLTAAGNTDMWGIRNNAPIAWTTRPTGLSNGSVWTVETQVRMNNVAQNEQVAGITFYANADGSKPDITFGLDNWDAGARAVRFQGLGDNVPNVGALTTASTVFLRMVVTEGGTTDTYNFFYKINAGDAWTQLTGAALNYTSSFDNSRVGLTYKTSGARDGVAFTYFNVQNAAAQPPVIAQHPTNLSAVLGGAARFTVIASGASSYQWRKNSVNISPGGNAATYVLDPVTAGDNGNVYDCIVSNINGPSPSNTATLTVVNAPVGGAYYSSAVQTEPSLFAYFPVDGSASPAVTNVKKPAFSGTVSGTAGHDSTLARTIGTRSITSNGAGWVGVTKDPEWNLADGNGTIELFAYQTASATYNPCLIGVRNDTGGGTRYSIHTDAAGTKIWFFNGSGAPTWNLPTNGIGRLMHLAFVINNGQCTLYHNGVNLGTVTQPLGPAFSVGSQIGSAGPSAQESFPGNIDEVALYADPLPASAITAHYNAWLNSTIGTPPTIATQPASQTVNEGASVTFSVTLNDATGATYRWQRNGVDIPSATNSSYSINPVTLADHTATFRCVIYTPFGGVTSNAAILSVNDITPPILVSASSPFSASKVILTFNEAVDLTGANFSIAGGSVTGAMIGPFPNMVTLTVTGLVPGQNYAVTASGVKDLTGNVLTTGNANFTAKPVPVAAPISMVRPGSEPMGPATRRGPFVFSEIHYNPSTRPDLKNLEFIELYNSQPWAENLTGYRITGEVNFAFPPGTIIPAGGYLVVAAVPADVASVYGITGVLGPWTGSLNNSGGEVRLKDTSNGEVFVLEYDPDPPWPVAADGAGHSLVLARPSLGMRDPKAWDASATINGSPGMAEPSPANPWRTVVINEIRANSGPLESDYIELYNYSNTAVDLAGCSLSDNPELQKYVFPNGTTIPAMGHVALDSAALLFSLKSSGDTVYFRAPGSPGVVLDALSFGGQFPVGVTYGRSEDGSPQFSFLASATLGTPNTAPRAKEAVISEIFYNPPVGNVQLPFVEITNTSGGTLDLSGWRLASGISYEFPPSTILAAGARLAVNSFTGKLNQSVGERLRLQRPVTELTTFFSTVDEVTYGTGGRWGRWSDGGGSSLERKDLRADGRLATSWADSADSAEGSWVTIEHTGVLDHGSGSSINRLHVMLLGEGECLIDDIEVIPSGGSNQIANGGFESGTQGWLLQGTHDASTLETGGFSGANSLHIRAAGRGDLAGNRLTVALGTALTPSSTATIRAKVKWLRGHPEILLRLNGGNLEATGNILPATVTPGTPATQNSTATMNAGPAITSVNHLPVLPQAGEATTVFAHISDPDEIGAAVLEYRIDPAANVSSVLMEYRGAGIFSAQIPAQASGTLVAFTVNGVDTFGASTQFPDDAPARECLVRWGEPASVGTLGAYRLWMTEATRSTWASRIKNSNTPLDVTFVYGNQRIIYNASAQYSGSPFHTPAFTGPTGAVCDYSCNAPTDDRFLGETDFILAGPGTFGDDTSFIREQTIWWMARQMGLPSIHRRFCKVFVNGTQRQTIFEDTQQPGGEWIDEYWPEDNDGHLHKAQDWIEYADDGATFQTDIRAHFTKRTTTGGAHKIANYRYQWSLRSVESANDWAPFTALVDAHAIGTLGTDAAYLAAMDPLVDETSWARALAIQRIAGNWDTWGWLFGKNMYMYKPTQGPWHLTAWDIDFSFGLVGYPANTGLFDATQDPLATKFRENYKFLRAYWCAFREAVDGPMLAANTNGRIDAMVAALATNSVTSDTNQVNMVKTYVNDRRNYILSQLNTAYPATTFSLNGSTTINDADGILTITGTAPPGVKTIRINGVEYSPNWTSAINWSLPLTLYSANNSLTVEGLSLDGDVLATFPLTVTVSGPPPLPPVFINEWMADNSNHVSDSADGGFEDWFELYNAGATPVNLSGYFLTDNMATLSQFPIPSGTIIPAGGYLLIWADGEPEQNGIIAGQLHTNFRLSAGGESLALSTPDGTVINSITFGAQRTDESQGRYPDGAADIVFPVPTPGKRNALSPDVLTYTDIGSGTSQFTFSTEPSHVYQLESTIDLGTWQLWGDALTATGTSLSVNLPRSETRRFWRARIIAP